MDGIPDTAFKGEVLLVNVNREGHVNASIVTHGNDNGYVWLADADATKLQLDNFQAILRYLQYTGSSLELSYLNNVMMAAEITSMQREGGNKEPLRRLVRYSCKGYECLNELENILSIQLSSENQKNDISGKRFSIQRVTSKPES